MAFRRFALFAIVATASAGLLPETYHQHHQSQQSKSVGAPIYEDVQEHNDYDYQQQQHKTDIVYQQVSNLGHQQQFSGSEHYQQQQSQDIHYENGPAEYEFSYDVHDEKTGDIKHQKEIRKGDFVQGEYSLVDADGHLRTVTYTADQHSGFNAQVHREEIKGFQAPVQQHSSEGHLQQGQGHSSYY